VHVVEGSSAEKALEPLPWRGGDHQAMQSPAWVKLCLEGLLGAELDGEGAADVAGLGVLAGPLIPAACEVHMNMERERSHLAHTNIYRERSRTSSQTDLHGAHELHATEREKPSRENQDGERERSTNPTRCTRERMKLLFERTAAMCRTDGS
jgi:hypothetical protein